MFHEVYARFMDKFYQEIFNLWKIKIEMFLAFINIWDIRDESENAPHSNTDPKLLKDYQRCIKKVMSIIGLNFADNQIAHQEL